MDPGRPVGREPADLQPRDYQRARAPLFFAASDVYAIVNPSGGQIEDYASKQGVAALTNMAAEIAAALAIFYLVCRWLAIPRALAGIPRTRVATMARGVRRRMIPSMQPTWLVAVAAIGGAVLSIRVSELTTPAGEAVSSTNLTTADNLPSMLGGALRSLNAGVVEEITIVALPVLLGRRTGWHPAVIVALSVLMRWPFHLYHGVWWTTLLWTMAWAAPHALAYLYLRRLWPLVIGHTCQDLLAFNAPHDIAYTTTIIGIMTIVGGAALRDHIGSRQRRRTVTDSAVTAVTYTRLDSGTITLKNKAKKLPDMWAALTAISQDQPHRPGASGVRPPADPSRPTSSPSTDTRGPGTRPTASELHSPKRQHRLTTCRPSTRIDQLMRYFSSVGGFQWDGLRTQAGTKVG